MFQKRPRAALVALVAVGVCVAVHAQTPSGGDVADSPQAIRPLLIGSTVPEVTLKTGDGTDIDLRSATAKKPTILIIYRGGW
jgi:hypothetical protein